MFLERGAQEGKKHVERRRKKNEKGKNEKERRTTEEERKKEEEKKEDTRNTARDIHAAYRSTERYWIVEIYICI